MGLLNKTGWSSEIHKELFEQKDYTSLAQNFSTMADMASFVLPQSGAITAGVDSYSRPLTATQRVDTGKTITLMGIVTDPYFVKLDEQHELSFDKRASISGHLVEAVADFAKTKVLWGWMNDVVWSSASVKTTGLSGATMPTGATGARKKITYNDIISANEKLDLQNVPQDGRVMIIHPSLYKDLKGLTEFVENQVYCDDLLKQGIVGTVDGIRIIKGNTNSVLINAVASGSTPSMLAYGATGTTASFGALVYHPNFVARVIGRTELFVNMNDALFTSDVMTLTQRVGGGASRQDGKGLVAIVQEIA